MDNLIRAYMAGIIDGEAYVGIKKSTWGQRNRADIKSPTYHERIQIKMNCCKILKLFKDNYGGSLYQEKKIYQSVIGFKTRKLMWVYGSTDKAASTILTDMLPLLIEKKRQAKLCLLLRKSKESKESRMRGGRNQKRKMSKKILDYRESLYQRIKDIHNE